MPEPEVPALTDAEHDALIGELFDLHRYVYGGELGCYLSRGDDQLISDVNDLRGKAAAHEEKLWDEAPSIGSPIPPDAWGRLAAHVETGRADLTAAKPAELPDAGRHERDVGTERDL